MATFLFDGSQSVTAAKADTVVISATPSLFTSVSETGGNVVFGYSNGNTLTVTGTTFSAGGLSNVSVAGGTFSAAATGAVDASGGGNALVIGPTAGAGAAINASNGTTTATAVKTVFGGLGIADSLDTADSINIGGKGSFLVYGNAGDDTVSQSVAFDSQSFVTVFGGKGTDAINLTTAQTGAKMAIYGGESTDTINVVNGGSSGVTTIFGGQGAADSTDGADTIVFNGGGQVNIFGNAGADTITLGGTGLDSTTVAVIHGGRDADTISVTVTAGVKASVSVFGDENATGNDTITVAGNAGTTVIYGGTAAADSADGADVISYSGQGSATIYAGGGDDSITLTGKGVGVTADSTSTTTVFGGNGKDTVTITGQADSIGTLTLTGGAGADVYVLGTADTGAAPVVGGPTAGTGTGITITDFVLGAGGDKLTVQNGVNTSGGQLTIVDGSGAQTLQTALNAAAQTANGVAAVVFQGNAYVVVNDGVAGFSATTDLAIKLTGITDLAQLATATTIA